MTRKQHEEHEKFFTWAVNLLRKENLITRHDRTNDIQANYQVVHFGRFRLVYHSYSSTSKGVYIFHESRIGCMASYAHPELATRLEDHRSASHSLPLDFRERALLAILLSYQIPSPSPA